MAAELKREKRESSAREMEMAEMELERDQLWNR